MRDGRTGVGVVGCGTISRIYLTNLTRRLPGVEVVAVADLEVDRARAAAAAFGVAKACGVPELLADPDVDLVLDLTVPTAHASVNRAALEAGKHVYCEKPLAPSLAEADDTLALASARGLHVGGAPDTFLGAGLQTCRKLIDEGAIGRPIGFTANIVSHGHELWFPAPVFHYFKGAGPLWDMGPYYLTALVHLLGPIRSVGAVARIHEPKREVQGRVVDVEMPSTYCGVLDFANGATGTVQASFDVWKSNLPRLEIYGTEGSLFVPDPNFFGGPVAVLRSADVVARIAQETTPDDRRGWLYERADELVRDVPLAWPEVIDERGIGVAEMADAIREGRPHRASGEMARHVVEAMEAFDRSGAERRFVEMRTTCDRPQAFANLDRFRTPDSGTRSGSSR